MARHPHPINPRLKAMRLGDNLCIKPHAPVAMNSQGAKLLIPHFWRSSTIRRCEQSSLPAAAIWAILTGEEPLMAVLLPMMR